MRAGRITASKFHQACRTDPASPSISLIKDVCYGSKFSSKASAWGNTYEKHALDRYRQVMQDEHKDFKIKDSGFVTNPEHPHLGADAISYCSCHGTGCVKIKCPYKARDSTITEAVGFLEKTANGCLQLDRKHLYSAQVQLQLFSTKLDFVDFVAWTPSDIFIECIDRDAVFISVNLAKAKHIYIKAILPELWAKWYTSKNADGSISGRDSYLYCYCRVQFSESVDLICSNQSCLFHRFHMKCCGLSRKPYTQSWTCPDCRRLRKMPAAARQQ